MLQSFRVLTVALLLSLAACGGAAEVEAPPSVLLISLDTVRADTLSCYGGPEGATPILDALAAAGTRYETCVASAPWTMPSHASMFTGLFPFEHGTHSFLPGARERGDNVYALHDRFETLAEALGDRGYRTAGIVANSIYLRPDLGLDAGFQTWDVKRQKGHGVTDRALAWLDASATGDRPVLLFLNYMDAHRPYNAGDAEARARKPLDGLIQQVMERGQPPGELARDVRALHQSAVTRLDAELGRLFDGLRERGLFERALIVVTSDHGEAFGEHGVVEHSKDVYEELVRVPLIVRAPGSAGGSIVGARASSVDVPGVIAAAFEGTAAASLASSFPRRPGNHAVVSEVYFSRRKDLRRFGDRFRRVRRASYDGTWKLVVDSAGKAELYDLSADAGERTNQAGELTDRVDSMAAALGDFMKATAFEGDRARPGQLTAQQRQDMAELGYAEGEDR